MSVTAQKTSPFRSIEKLTRANGTNTSIEPSALKPNVTTLHQESKIPIIQFGHLQEYFISADGEKVGQAEIRDKQSRENIIVDVIRTKKDNGEVYKLVKDGEVIAFREIKIDKGTVDQNESSLTSEVREVSPIVGFETNKNPCQKIILEFIAAKDPNRYGNILGTFNQIILERLQQIEDKEGIELKGIQLISSWNSGQSHFTQGLHIQDRTGMDTISAKKCDKYIQEQIDKAGSAEKADTELLGCTTMYLPWSSRRKWKKEIKKNPIFNTNNFDNGKVTLTKNDGKTKVEAQVTKVHDANTKIDTYKISYQGKELGSIQLNQMKVNQNDKVNDYCGDYDESSPFSQYGNGYLFGLGAKKARSKIFVEIHETLSKDFTNLNEALFQIPAEIAYKDKVFGGRVMVEGDWKEHGVLANLGFKTQKYRGKLKAKELEQAYKEEMASAKKEGRIANLKQFGSQLMTMTKAEMLEKFQHSKPILTTAT